MDLNAKISMLLCSVDGSQLRFSTEKKFALFVFDLEVSAFLDKTTLSVKKSDIMTPGDDALDAVAASEAGMLKGISPIALLINAYEISEEMSRLKVPYQEVFMLETAIEAIQFSLKQWGGGTHDRI